MDITALNRVIDVNYITSIPQMEPNERDLDSQLRALQAVTFRLGLHDASDFIRLRLVGKTFDYLPHQTLVGEALDLKNFPQVQCSTLDQTLAAMFVARRFGLDRAVAHLAPFFEGDRG